MPKTHIICLTLFSLRYFSKNINRFMFNEFFLMCFHCSWAGLLSIAPLKKVLPFAFFFFKFTRPSKAGKEPFLRQILLSGLRLDTV